MTRSFASLRRTFAVTALFAVAGGTGLAKETPRLAAASETNGISTARLQRAKSVLQSLVDKGELAGLVTLIIRDGRVVDLSAFGVQDLETRAPMRTDSIFRIASMTKLVTSTAVMMLFEEGRVALSDPVSRYLPEFEKVQVLGANGSLVAAKIPMTIHDLLTHRSGLTYGFIDGGTVGSAYRRLGVSDGLTVTEGTIGDNVKRLAQAPLLSQPGTEYNYSLSTDVLGRLVEVASGNDLETFFSTRIFAPLKMKDTGFSVPDADWSRFASAYTAENGKLRLIKDPEQIQMVVYSPIAYYKPGKKYFSGGAGLVSTASDYGRFLQMLASGGVLDGVRLLGPKTVELMTVSHTSDLAGDAVGRGIEFGLGVAVTTDLGRSAALGSPGAWSWGGIYGTTYWVDTKERLIGVLMAQRFPEGDLSWNRLFQTLVYQALVK
jgi:CubicO group peptidase (beta-lactamase class C family)